MPKSDKLILLGDFNARVGNDRESWPDTIGAFGIGKINENGQHLLELSAKFQLCVANTYTQCKDHHNASWMHPRSMTWHQLDLILIRRRHLNDVTKIRPYNSAACDTDHSLVISNMKLSPKPHHRGNQHGKLELTICIRQLTADYNKTLKH